MSNWITIELDKLEGSAFEGDDLGPELGRILRCLALQFEGLSRESFVNDEYPRTLHDINGNKVGTVSGNFEPDEDEQEMYDSVRHFTKWMSFHEIAKFVEDCGMRVSSNDTEEDLVEAIVEAVKAGDISLDHLEDYASKP